MQSPRSILLFFSLQRETIRNTEMRATLGFAIKILENFDGKESTRGLGTSPNTYYEEQLITKAGGSAKKHCK